MFIVEVVSLVGVWFEAFLEICNSVLISVGLVSSVDTLRILKPNIFEINHKIKTKPTIFFILFLSL